MTDLPNDLFIDLTVGIVSAYVAHNTLPASRLADLIAEVHAALGRAVSGPALQPTPEIVAPAVQLRKSVTPDFIVCLEDGKRFKSLKRHLRTAHGLSAEAYREKWGLPADYPMVAANYSEARSTMAKAIGLGRPRGRRAG
ncbi:MucR family transcriptional regulator [Pinisolibacter aquiterrae]|uniref:MucR family transcriptional regulator n=1 Tax=Pinisolibacter aquiterrae TaxID=2815579 RepID=UPI001C3C45E8|nr:MucR family transcriptional regulator [Pinisolibacter aquiterrae]MBV5266484.1 MucR family transcriptional regulator [Pinisolibacter aquiterrae]MCC8234744.1 MucR family transcriptional regulator [Pinisolibacter aquiterrae]